MISEEVKTMTETQPVRTAERNRRAVIVAVMMSKYKITFFNYLYTIKHNFCVCNPYFCNTNITILSFRDKKPDIKKPASSDIFGSAKPIDTSVSPKQP